MCNIIRLLGLTFCFLLSSFLHAYGQFVLFSSLLSVSLSYFIPMASVSLFTCLPSNYPVNAFFLCVIVSVKLLAARQNVLFFRRCRSGSGFSGGLIRVRFFWRVNPDTVSLKVSRSGFSLNIQIQNPSEIEHFF